MGVMGGIAMLCWWGTVLRSGLAGEGSHEGWERQRHPDERLHQDWGWQVRRDVT